MINLKENIKTSDNKKQNGFKDTFLGLNKYFPSFFKTSPLKMDEISEEFRFHSQIFNSSSLLSISDLNGNIIYVNDRFCRVSKYQRKELIGNSYKIIRHPETPSFLFKDMWKKISIGETWQGEIKNRAKDGSSFWVFSTITPIIDANNKPMKYMGMHIDITHKKKIELELKEAMKIIDLDLYENVNYAKQIHSALLTNEEEIRNTFPQSFLIYKAQKIISGDFYGLYSQNNKSIIVVGDSTGHGISASYISILALNIIHGALKNGFNHPEEILQEVHCEMHHVTHLNNKKGITESADTIMCSIDHHSYILNYSSAKMRGIIVRNGEIIELKKDKCSIGEFSSKRLQLTKHTIQLKKNDCIYLFSDGIADQFGGDGDKKYGYKNLQKTLKEVHGFPMQNQKEKIATILETWQGSNEQTDDMTLLGFQIE